MCKRSLVLAIHHCSSSSLLVATTLLVISSQLAAVKSLSVPMPSSSHLIVSTNTLAHVAVTLLYLFHRRRRHFCHFQFYNIFVPPTNPTSPLLLFLAKHNVEEGEFLKAWNSLLVEHNVVKGSWLHLIFQLKEK
ncbi:RNA polymerase II C-terminal domain phosphatase-like protein [Trifolium medium]|uniref:RNA polymerase II C-terminal domain phosphatase-like protein n=1 Tax=Trifolium medium TaxID=97028 RepID=A0A392NYG8_9FABA|nr:RNA polymerase II C-terminal domain phosphatase-like protein [Trifolium medium]